MTNHDAINSPGHPSINKELLLSIPIDHACYADHFPGNPLVPGALLLKWILALIECEFNCKILRLKNIKFLAPVKPADILNIIMNTHLPSPQLSFTIFVRDTLVIKGSIEYGTIDSGTIEHSSEHIND